MARFLVSGGTGNWNSTTNWSATSGGASGASFPTVADDVVIDGNSVNTNLTINVLSACLSLSATSYTGTVTFTAALSNSGNLTLASGMTFAGASNLILINGGSVQTNGKVISVPFFFQGTSKTYTLLDDLVVSALFTCNGSTLTTINNSGGNIKLNSGYTQTTVATVNGTASLTFQGTGTWTSTLATNVLRLNTTINTSGTITLATNVGYNTGTLTYTAGTVITAGNTLTIGANTTLNTSGMGTTTNAWNNISPTTSGVIITLTSDLYGTGTLQSNLATTNQFNGAFNVNWMGTVTVGVNWSGTATLVFVGNTTFGGSAGSSILSMNMTWSSGTITQSAFTYRTNTWTINSGIVVSSSGIITINTGSPILTNNATGITFNEIDCGGVPITFNGTQGFTISTLKFIGSAAGAGISFKSSNTYIITSAFSTTTATAALPWILSASTGGVQTILTLNQGATQSLGFVNATDINSSTGQTIWDFRGTLSNTTNWNLLIPPPTVSIAFAS